MKDYRLEISLKITDKKVLILNRSYILFNKPRVAVGLWNNSVVFATNNPKTMDECQVLIYTIAELKEFYEEGSLKGLADIDQMGVR